MVDETSEQKRLKDRVAQPLLIKHAAPLIGYKSPVMIHRYDSLLTGQSHRFTPV